MSEKTKSDLVAPDGYVLIKKGGRPSKLPRDAAVFIARAWRMKCLKESAGKADRWIIENFPGLTESAHVRAAIRRTSKTFLNGCSFVFNEVISFANGEICRAQDRDRILCEEWLPFERLPPSFNLSKCAISAIDSPTGIQNMRRGAIWVSGMREAKLLKLVPIRPIEREMESTKTAIAIAVRQQVTAN